MCAYLSVGGQVVITNRIGLHARPAISLSKLARTFNSSIRISKREGEKGVDAKSIVRVVALKAKVGETLFIRAVGPDAQVAVKSLTTLVKKIFEDESEKA